MPSFSAATMDSITTNEMKFNTKVGGSKISNRHILCERVESIGRVGVHLEPWTQLACLVDLSVLILRSLALLGGHYFNCSRSKTRLMQQLLGIQVGLFLPSPSVSASSRKVSTELLISCGLYIYTVNYKLVEYVNEVAHVAGDHKL